MRFISNWIFFTQVSFSVSTCIMNYHVILSRFLRVDNEIDERLNAGM